jgi:hypothetical protein
MSSSNEFALPLPQDFLDTRRAMALAREAAALVTVYDPGMNFSSVLQTVTDFLDAQGARYAVIGGVALVMYGLPRTTLDLDLVVDFSIQDDLIH